MRSQTVRIGRTGGGLAEEWDATVTGARYVEMTCVTISFVWVVHTTLLGLLLLEGKLYCVLQNSFCICVGDATSRRHVFLSHSRDFVSMGPQCCIQTKSTPFPGEW